MGNHRKKSKSVLNNNATPQTLPPGRPLSKPLVLSKAFSTPRKKSIMPSSFSISEPSDFRDSPSYIAQQKAKNRKAADDGLKHRFTTSTAATPGADTIDAAFARLNAQSQDTPKKDRKDKDKKQGNTPFTNKLLEIKDASSSEKSHSKPTLDLEGLKELQAKQHSTPKHNSNNSTPDKSQNKSAESSHKKKKDEAKSVDGTGNSARAAEVSGTTKSLTTSTPSLLKTSSIDSGKTHQHKTAESSQKKKKKEKAKSVEADSESTKVVEKSGHSEATAAPAEPLRSKATEKSTTAKKDKSKDSSHKKDKDKDKDKKSADKANKVTAESANVQVPATPTNSSHAKEPAPVNSHKKDAAESSNKKKKKSKKSSRAKDDAASEGGSVSADAPACASKVKHKKVEAAIVAEKDKPAEVPKESSKKSTKKSSKKSSKKAKKRAEGPRSDSTTSPTKTTEKEKGDNSGEKQVGISNEAKGHTITTASAESGSEKAADGKTHESEESSSSESDIDAEEDDATESDATEQVVMGAKAGAVEDANAIEAKGRSSGSESDADKSEIGPVSKVVKEMTKKPHKKKIATEFKSAERVTPSDDEDSNSSDGSRGSESDKEPGEGSKSAIVQDLSDAQEESKEGSDSSGDEQDGSGTSGSSSSSSGSEAEDDDDDQNDNDATTEPSQGRQPTTEQHDTPANPRKRKRDDSSTTTSTVASRNPPPDPSLFPSAKAAAAGTETGNPNKKLKKNHTNTNATAVLAHPRPIPGASGNAYPRILVEQMNALEGILDEYKYKGDEEVDPSIRLIALLDNAKSTILKLAERKIVSRDVPGATMQMQLARIARDREAEITLLRSQVWELMEEQNVKKSGKKGR